MAYYSKSKTWVYHECKNCDAAFMIHKENMKTGKPPIVVGGRMLGLCPICARLKKKINAFLASNDFPRRPEAISQSLNGIIQ